MGSKSDIGVAEKAETTLKEFGVEFETFVMSAHRTPNKVRAFARAAEQNGFGAVIAIAGLAAHLPGVIASMTALPVIGVPVEAGPLAGEDALLAIVHASRNSCRLHGYRQFEKCGLVCHSDSQPR